MTIRSGTELVGHDTGNPYGHTLTARCQFDLHPTAPFNFDGTVHHPDYFPSPDNDWQPGLAWWTLRLDEQTYGLKLEEAGSVDTPRLHLTLFADHPTSAAEAQAVADEIGYELDLYLDLSEFNMLLENDALLSPILPRWRGVRNQCSTLYRSLVIYVVLQNTVVRRTIQMMDNLLRTYGTLLHFDSHSLYVIWSPQVLDMAPEEHLRALKVGYRAKSLKRISAAFVHGEIDAQRLRTLSNEELRCELLKLYGIGPASVWYLMFADFHRYDAFEYISPWEQKIYSRLLFNQELVPSEQILSEVEHRWGRWKMLASHYLFEDLFWRHEHEPIPWLEKLIRR